ncbi:MAG: NAD(P)H-binding protein [Desertimonas sp.]
MSRLLLIGGHGKVAMLTSPLLTVAGHTVDAVIRNPDHAPAVAATGAGAVVADVERMDLDALTRLVGGHDAVIWSAGAGGGNPARTVAVDRDAAIRSIDAAVAAGVGRYVMVSYTGSGIDDVPPSNPFHHYAAAKAAADDHLRASPLDWTILGPSRLVDGPATGSIELTDGHATEVPRADVARVVAAVIDQPATVGRTIRFNRGSTPIAEALARPER